MSRKRGAGISNRVRAKRLSRLLPSAGSCTSAERVGGGPEVSWEQRDEAGISRCGSRVLSGASARGIVAPRRAAPRRSSHVRGAMADLGMPVSLRKIDESKEGRARINSAKGGTSFSGLFILGKKKSLFHVAHSRGPTCHWRRVLYFTLAITWRLLD